MVSMRRVFLARNSKTNFHSLFIVVPSDYEQKRCGSLDIETFNQLVLWKNLDELVSALERTGPVIASDVFKEAQRLIPVQEAVEIAEAGGRGPASQGYGLNDEAFLYMQLYLDGRSGFYPSKASVSRGIANHGLLESGALSDLRRWAKEDPGAKVVVEPVADVCFARNLCGIALRMVANYQNSEVENVLEASGFEHVERKRKWWNSRDLKSAYYVIPFHHNAADDMTINFSWKCERNAFAYMLNDPLVHLIYESKPRGVKHSFGSIESAVIIASPAFTGIRRPIVNVGFDYENEDTRAYLAICDDVSQRDAAALFLEGLAETISGLVSKRKEPLGWDFSKLPDFFENDAVEPVFYTLFSAMVGKVVYRAGALPTTCKHCGNGFFIKPKGKRREFCSDSCRSQFSAENAKSNG